MALIALFAVFVLIAPLLFDFVLFSLRAFAVIAIVAAVLAYSHAYH